MRTISEPESVSSMSYIFRNCNALTLENWQHSKKKKENYQPKYNQNWLLKAKLKLTLIFLKIFRKDLEPKFPIPIRIRNPDKEKVYLKMTGKVSASRNVLCMNWKNHETSQINQNVPYTPLHIPFSNCPIFFWVGGWGLQVYSKWIRIHGTLYIVCRSTYCVQYIGWVSSTEKVGRTSVINRCIHS